MPTAAQGGNFFCIRSHHKPALKAGVRHSFFSHYIPAFFKFDQFPGSLYSRFGIPLHSRFFVHYIPCFSTTTLPLCDPSRPNLPAQRCVALRSAAQCFVTAAQEMHENKATRAPEKLVVTCSRKHVRTCRREGNRAGRETGQDVQDEIGDARLAA